MGVSVSKEIEAATGMAPANPKRPFAGVDPERMRDFLGVGVRDGHGRPNVAAYAAACGLTRQAVGKWADEPGRVNAENADAILETYAEAQAEAGGFDADHGPHEKIRELRAEAIRFLFKGSYEANKADVDGTRVLSLSFACHDLIDMICPEDLPTALRLLEALVRTGRGTDPASRATARERAERLLNPKVGHLFGN